MDLKKQEVPDTLEIPEDLLALSRIYSFTKLSYIDISRQEQLTKMMEHWPLFAELAQLANKQK